VRVAVRALICEKFVNTIGLSYRLCEFHQIYNFRTVGQKDKRIRFWSQKVKETKYGQISILLGWRVTT